VFNLDFLLGKALRELTSRFALSHLRTPSADWSAFQALPVKDIML
jgi:hypothetical protein